MTATRHIDRARTVGYRFEGDFEEGPVGRVLERARAAGVVTEFDTGRGRVVWFNGRPGAALRAVRAEVERLAR